MKTLLRGWFFRIFAGLSVLIIGIFNIAANIPDSGAPFIYRALPASLPYINLLVLNIGQAIVAVFLASEFLKQDRKNDTIEVIYARSMTNAEYILGKAFGVLLVFLFLNILMLSIGVGFSFLSGDASQGILEYLYYPLLISLPTLVYILGLSFFMMIVTRNQAITFIVLLGYIALSVFYLDKKFYQVFDFIAYQIPMMKSTVGGFADLHGTVIHRGIYFFIGLALIFFTITKLDRLPQSKKFRFLPWVLSILFLFAGVGLGYEYINNKKYTVQEKQAMISLNNQYLNYPKVNVDSCDIDLEHLGSEIKVSSRLVVTNKNITGIDTIILSLNPDLEISKMKLNNKTCEFDREKQIIKVIPERKLNPGESARVDINYSGSIDENTCFLDQNLDDFKDNFSFEIFRLKKRYAYLQPDYVLLTREALWYPVSGVGYASNSPLNYTTDFTNYHLKVKTTPGMMAISQGTITDSTSEITGFATDVAIPQISLVIGDYTKKSIFVDSIEYSIFTIDGNDYYSEYFTDIADSLPGIIRDLKNKYETEISLSYPFKRFSIVEAPIQYFYGKHLYSLTSDAVQPEMTFYSEKGVLIEETDFKKRKKRTESRMRRNKEEITPTELQSRIFKRFTEGNFMAPHTERYFFDYMDRNTLSIFPNYVTFSTSLQSEKWPALNMSLQSYLKDRYSNPISTYRWFSEDLSRDERINLELKNSSLSGFEKLHRKEETDDNEVALHDIVLAKGDFLFSILRARYGEDSFNKVLDEFIENHKGQSTRFSALDSVMKENFGESIINDINDWYYGTSLPGFMIKDLETYKVLEEDHTKYQVRFKIANPEDTDGVVTINIDLYDPNERGGGRRDDRPPDLSERIHIPAKTAKEVGFVFTSEPERMNIYTHISLNLPNNLIYDFGSFDKIKKVTPFEGVNDCDLFRKTIAEGEIIIDNEDSSFTYIQENQISYLKRLVDENRNPGYPYSRIRWWNPPAGWQHVLRSGFYGTYVRSATYTRSGQGDRMAKWEAPLDEEGYYDIYFHIEKINVNRRRQTKKSDYNFKVYHEGGVEEMNFTDGDMENGWNYMGTYFITPETAKVELSNESVGSMVFADAVKWVKN